MTNARDKQTVLCPLLISNFEPAVAVIAGALDFTVCYDLTKVHFDSADCMNTSMLLLSRIKNGYDSSVTAMYFERFWFRFSSKPKTLLLHCM